MLQNLKPKTYREGQALIGKAVNITLKVSDRPLKYEIITWCRITAASRRWLVLHLADGTERRVEAFRATLITENTNGP